MTNTHTYLTFPCEFPIKIIAENNEKILDEISEIVRQHFPLTEDNAIQHRTSNQARYRAITVTIEVHDRLSLDALYLALTKHPSIKMVL